MLNGIDLANSDISKLLKGTRKNIKDAKGSYTKKDSDSSAYVETGSDNEADVSNLYNKKGLVSKKEFQLKEDTILPERYNTKLLSSKVYYKGEQISQMDLIETAVQEGVIELDEEQSIWENYRSAWKALIQDNAKPLYNWSSSLYSEDGKYKFRVEDGEITGLISTKISSGVSLQDMAYELANGKSPDEVPDVSWLSWNDRELYDAACNVGKAKNLYNEATSQYRLANISYQDYLDKLEPIFFVMYGDYMDEGSKVANLEKMFASENYAQTALENYNPTKYSIVFSEE